MNNPEDIDPGTTRYRPLAAPTYRPLARAQASMTWEQAAVYARQVMCGMDGSWCNRSLQEVATRVCSGNDLFVGSNPGNVDILVRCGLGCPTSAQTCPGGNGGNGGGASTGMILLGVVGLAVVGGVAYAISKQGKKKILVARV